MTAHKMAVSVSAPPAKNIQGPLRKHKHTQKQHTTKRMYGGMHTVAYALSVLDHLFLATLGSFLARSELSQAPFLCIYGVFSGEISPDLTFFGSTAQDQKKTGGFVGHFIPHQQTLLRATRVGRKTISVQLSIRRLKRHRLCVSPNTQVALTCGCAGQDVRNCATLRGR